MKVLAFIVLAVTFPVQASDANKECEAAVDAADSMNVNQKGCDYSDKGLNGFLQKAFKKGDEGAVLSTSANNEKKQVQSVAAGQAYDSGLEKKTSLKGVPVLSVEVDQWANVSLAKNQLLPKIMERCSKGFSVTGESYRALPMGRIELTIHYACL